MNDLKKAIDLHQSGEIIKARGLYKELVKKAPTYEIFKLLATTYYQCQEHPQAISYYKKSLTLNPNQSDAVYNLGVCYLHTGNSSAAKNEFSKAIFTSGNQTTLVISVLTLMLNHRAYRKLNELLLALPAKTRNLPEVLTIFGKSNIALEQYEVAIDELKQALSIDEHNIQALHSIGIAYRMLGDFAKAINSFETLINLGIKDFSVYHNLANANNDAGHYDQAIEYYRKAISANPLYRDSHKNLNSLLWALNRQEEFLHSYKQVDWTKTEATALAIDAVEYYFKLGDTKSVAQLLSSANSDTLRNPEIRMIIGKILLSQGSIRQGTQEVASCAKHLQDPNKVCACAEILITHNRSETAFELIKTVLDLDRGNIYATAVAYLLRRLGYSFAHDMNARFDQALIKKAFSDRLFKTNQKIKRAILDLHQTSTAPIEQTLVNGTQSNGNLFNSKDPYIAAVLEEIKAKTTEYLQSLSADHFLRRKILNPHKLEFSGAWSVVLHNQGYHGMHIHPMGILSAVYYIETPHQVDVEDLEKMGWLKFGEPNFSHPQLTAEHFFKPTAGSMVIFPSYFWHGTIPFKSTQPRVTIAVDIISSE